MRYRVIFRERSDAQGGTADDPPSFLDAQLDDETVSDSVFVRRIEPEAQHSTEELDEDDSFLSLGTEVWDFEVVDGKDQEFRDALLNSGMVVEFEVLEASDELGIT